MTVTKWSKLGFSQVDARNWKSVSKIHVAKSLLQLATDIRKITFWSCAFFLARVWTNSSILSQKVGRDYLPSANNWLTVLETCWRSAHRMKRRVCFFFSSRQKTQNFCLICWHIDWNVCRLMAVCNRHRGELIETSIIFDTILSRGNNDILKGFIYSKYMMIHASKNNSSSEITFGERSPVDNYGDFYFHRTSEHLRGIHNKSVLKPALEQQILNRPPPRTKDLLGNRCTVAN